MTYAYFHRGTSLAFSAGTLPSSKIHFTFILYYTETNRRGLSPVKLINYAWNEVRKKALTDS